MGVAAACTEDGTTASMAPTVAVEDLAGATPFHGEHQAGIVTAAQDRLHFAAFDVITKDRERLVDLLRQWTAASARMTEGRSAGVAGPMDGELDAPPEDTGEAYGLPPSGLTNRTRPQT